jgi:hypothetical protein
MGAASLIQSSTLLAATLAIRYDSPHAVFSLYVQTTRA